MSKKELIECDSGLGCGESYVKLYLDFDSKVGADWMQIGMCHIPVNPGEPARNVTDTLNIGPACVKAIYANPHLLLDLLRKSAEASARDYARRDVKYHQAERERVRSIIESIARENEGKRG